MADSVTGTGDTQMLDASSVATPASNVSVDPAVDRVSSSTTAQPSALAPSVTTETKSDSIPTFAPAPKPTNISAPVASQGPSVSFVFGGSKKSPTFNNQPTLAYQPVAIAPAPFGPTGDSPATEANSSSSRKRKRLSTAEQQQQQAQAQLYRRTSARHRSYEEPAAPLEDSATASSRRINYAESSDESEDEGDESDGDPPGMGSKDTDYNPDSERILAVKREGAGVPTGSTDNARHTRHYNELEDINYSVPRQFTMLVSEIADARGDTLFVRDDSTGKVASAYMHVVCAYRLSGCPFILKLTKAKEGGWTLKSAGLPQPGEADPKARSNYTCIHLPGAEPGPVPSMPPPGEGFLPGEGFAKKPAPPRKRPPPPRNHSQSVSQSPAQPSSSSASATRRTSRPISSTRPFDSPGSYQAGSGFAPPYQPSPPQQQSQGPDVTGIPSSSSVKYRSSMGSSNTTEAPGPGDERALAPPFKRSLNLAQQIVPALGNGPSSQSRAPPLTTFPQQASGSSHGRSKAAPEPQRSRSGHRHGLHSNDHSYCCSHACPYERIVVAHLLSATVTQPGASMSILQEVQEKEQQTAGPLASAVPTSILDGPRPDFKNDWHAFLNVYDSEVLATLAEILSSPVFGVTPKIFFASSRQTQLAFIDMLAQSPTVPIFPRLQLRDRVASGAIELAWLEMERISDAGNYAASWDEKVKSRKDLVDQIQYLQDKLKGVEEEARSLQTEEQARYREALDKVAAEQPAIFVNGKEPPADTSTGTGPAPNNSIELDGTAAVSPGTVPASLAPLVASPSISAPLGTAPRAPSPLGTSSSTAAPPFVATKAAATNGISSIHSSIAAVGNGATPEDEDSEMDVYQGHRDVPSIVTMPVMSAPPPSITTPAFNSSSISAPTPSRRKSSEHGIPGLSPPASPAGASRESDSGTKSAAN